MRVHGRKSSGKKAHTPVEAANTLQSSASAAVTHLISGGEILGLVDLVDGGTGERSIFLSDTRLENEDGSKNFQGVEWQFRPGTVDQEPFEGVEGVETPSAQLRLEVKQALPITRQITTDPNVDSVRVSIYVPALYTQEDDGDLVGASVTFRIESKSNKDATWRAYGGGDVTLSDKCSSPAVVDYLLPIPRPDLSEGEPYSVQVRVTRVSADSGSAKVQNAIYFDSYATIISAKLRYSRSAMLRLSAQAEQFGNSIPPTGFEVYGRKVLVPTGYDPKTRSYPAFWDGTFQRAWTDNPAWIFYDAGADPIDGLGEMGKEPAVDKWELYKIARFCDELVPDGQGGMEPRYRFAYSFATREDAYQALAALASAFRAMLWLSGEGLVPSADMPADPVKRVTPANVIGGRFVYSGVSLQARKSVAIVTWNDPADGYKTAQEVVEDPELIERFGWNAVDVTAVGTVWLSQARRAGLWALETERHPPETVSYQAAQDHADLCPGQIIEVVDPRRMGVRRGGRLKAASAGAVTLDAPVTLAAGEGYDLGLVAPSGALVLRAVTNGAGTHEVLTLAEPLPAAEIPQAGAVWTLSGADAAPRLYRVLTNKESDVGVYDVTAINHDPDKWPRIEQGLTVEPPNYSAIPTGPVAAPKALSALEFQVMIGAGYAPALTVSWTRSADARASFYRVQMRRPGEGWETVADQTQDASVSIRSGLAQGGPYAFRIFALDGFGGRTSAPAQLDGVWIEGKTSAPSNVLALQARIEQGGVVVSWERVPDVDAAAYEVRQGADWTTAPTLWRGQALSTPALPLFAPGSYVLQVKAFDQHGNESLVPASAVVEIHAPGAPTVAYALVGDRVRFSVSPVAGSYPLAETSLTDGSATWGVQSGALDAPVAWTGPRLFTATSWDVHGASGPAREIEVTIADVTAPTGLVSTSLPYSVHLAVAAPLSPWLEAIEIWAGTTSDRAGAAKIGETTSGEFVHSGLPLVAARYYWARCRDAFGSLTGFFPLGAGVRGTTLSDPAYFTTLLEGQLSEDQLTQALQSRLAGLDVAFVDDDFVEEGFFATLAENTLGLVAKDASVEQRMEILEDVEGGLYAFYLLRLDVNGHVVGMGMMNDGQYGEVAFSADKFLIAPPGVPAAQAPFYVGELPGGGTGVAIRGDLIAKGSILAQSLAVEFLSAISADLGEITAGRLTTGDLVVSEGGRVVVGAQNVIIDSGTDSLIIAPNGGPVAGNDYLRLDKGSMLFRYWNAATNAHETYDPLARLEDGVANSGDWVFIPGLWREQPRVRVSLNTLLGYDPAYANQPQTWNVRAEGLVEYQPRKWKFQAIARLELGGANGEKAVNLDSGSTASNAWTSAEAVTPANCTAATVTVQFSSVRGTGVAPNYYYRRVRWRVGYALTAGGPYAWTDYQTKNVGATVGQVSDSRAVNFGASGTWRYVVDCVAEDAGGTFTSGTGGYEYNPSPTVVSHDGVSNRALVQFYGNESVHYATATATFSVPAVVPPSGWEIYRVVYAFRYDWGIGGLTSINSVSGQSYPSGDAATVTLPNGATFSSDGDPGWLDGVWDATALVPNLVATAYYNDANRNGGYASVQLGNVTATVYFRKAIANSATPSNDFISQKMAYTLTTASVIAQGSCNWLAVGK